MSLELIFEKIDPFQDFLDFGVIGIPVDAVGKEKAVEKTVRFDQHVQVHELPPKSLVFSELCDLDISCTIPKLEVYSSNYILSKRLLIKAKLL